MTISVCMAVYNGEKYLKKQILSILDQIGDQDEIVIVDDCSIDRSLEIINGIKDSRIIIIKNEINQGVIKSFEISLNKARGDLIFLSDQDDIWLPTKVTKFLDVWNNNPNVTLVTSDAEIINERGELMSKSFFKIRGKFTSKTIPNLLKNRYHGCTIAFKKDMLRFFLPFPADIPMHDLWIGLVNSVYGDTFYIEEQLIQYRIHHKNTGRGISNHAEILQMIKWRLLTVKNLVKILFKNGWKKTKINQA